MKYIILLMCLSSCFCGINGNQQVSIQGTTNSNINVVFEFITQVEQLCQADLLQSSYPTLELYNQAVAECTFSNLSLLQTQALTQNCGLPNLTPDQQQLCTLLGK